MGHKDSHMNPRRPWGWATPKQPFSLSPAFVRSLCVGRGHRPKLARVRAYLETRPGQFKVKEQVRARMRN